MLLATTADRSFWKEDERMLFLGQWCLLYADKAIWSGLDYEVMEYPFDDRQRLYEAYCYLQGVYDRLMPKVAGVLNEIHKTDHGDRFWEIVAGYWFLEYIEVLYERYICLKSACESFPVSGTRVMSESFYLTPDDTCHFDDLYKGDSYNAQLYSQIIRHLRLVDFEEVKDGGGGVDYRPFSRRKAWVSTLKQAVKWLSFIPSRWNRYFLISTYLPPTLLLKLSLRLKIFPLLDSPRFPVKFKQELDRRSRNKLLDISGIDEFEQLVIQTLPVNFPKIYLENYGAAHALGERFFPKKVAVIATALAFASNDVFKIWCARQVEGGVPYAILQHGGSYGCARWNSSEDYETRVADKYLTYGWDDGEKKNVQPFFMNRLPYVESGAKNWSKDGCILWVLASFPRYSYSMYSVPVGPQFLDYLDEQSMFIKSLCPEARDLVKCRPYMHDYGWSDLERIKESGCEFKMADTSVSMWRQLRSSRLFIGTFNATAFLEAFVANVPTIMYWNPSHWEIREEARPYFDRLHDAGILHYSPESAADKVNLILGDTIGWWSQPHIQQVRSMFCDRFARTAKNEVDEWVKMISRLSGKN